MAKKTELSPAVLFLAASILVSAGWAMKAFPLFIFLGFAPLFALTDRTQDSNSIWEKMEWVLLALSLSFIAALSFDFTRIVSSLLFAILFTLSFIGHVWVRRTLGKRVGKVTIVFFWLATEYIILKVSPARGIFLADAVRLHPDWMRWNIHTGFLGASLWILLANLAVYKATLSSEPFQWQWILLAVVILAGPIIYSLSLDNASVNREEMIAVYTGKTSIKDVTYLVRNEFIVRTAAWLSTLIILFTFVKSQVAK